MVSNEANLKLEQETAELIPYKMLPDHLYDQENSYKQFGRTHTRRWLQTASTEAPGNGPRTPEEEDAEQTDPKLTQQKDKV